MDSVATRFQREHHEASLRKKAVGSVQRYQRACASLAGGVSSSLRRSAQPFPLFLESGSGSHVVDVDGNTYIDFQLAWGPLILGHTPRSVNEAVAAAMEKGSTFGAQHDLEINVAETLCRIIPCADRVAFANSGTEIVQVALRLARGFTGREKYLKFEGHYHGWDDSVLVSYHPATSQLDSTGEPIPVGTGQRPQSGAVVAQWNDRQSVESVFREHGGEIAAILCEPLLCNSGSIPAEPGFLEWLKEIAHANGALLIFDEVITGFRLAPGGAQEAYGVVPDLATFAKAIGGGMPLSALAGRADVMDLIATGKVVHAGTLNGNLPVLAAAKATLAELEANGGAAYERMHRLGHKLRQGLVERLLAAGIAVCATGSGSVFSLHFQTAEPRTYRDTLKSDSAAYVDFAVALLDEGVMTMQDARWYVSAAHTEADIDAALKAVDRALEGQK